MEVLNIDSEQLAVFLQKLVTQLEKLSAKLFGPTSVT